MWGCVLSSSREVFWSIPGNVRLILEMHILNCSSYYTAYRLEYNLGIPGISLGRSEE